MPIPNAPITVIPPVGGFSPTTFAFPGLRPIKIFDKVGPGAANRQPEVLEKRDDTIKDATNKAIVTLNHVTGFDVNDVAIYVGGGPDYMPRDASYAWGSNAPMDLAGARIANVDTGVDDLDVVNVAQLNAAIPALANFLVRDGTGNMDGSLNMQSDSLVDQKIINLAPGIAGTDGVNKAQLDALAASGGNATGPGVLVDYKSGELAVPTTLTDYIPMLTLTLDNPGVTMWLIETTMAGLQGGAGVTYLENHSAISCRYDVGTRRLSGQLYALFSNSAAFQPKFSAAFDAILPSDGTEVLVGDMPNLNAGTYTGRIYAKISANSPNQLTIRAYYTSTVPPSSADIPMMTRLSGTWRAQGFSGFGGASAATVAGLTYIPATAHTVHPLLQQVSTAGLSNVSYGLNGFAGVTKDKIVAVFVRTQTHISTAGNKQYWEVRAQFGGNPNYSAIGGSMAYDQDDDNGRSGMAIIPINNAVQSTLEIQFKGDYNGGGWVADATDDINWSAGGVEFEILGFWVTAAQSASGATVVFRSPWVGVDINVPATRVATYSHGLGDLPDFCEVYFRYQPTPGVYRVIKLSRTESAGGEEGNYSITDIGTSELTIQWGQDISFTDRDTSGIGQVGGVGGPERVMTSGEYRIVAGILSGNLDKPQLLPVNQYLTTPDRVSAGGNWYTVANTMVHNFVVDATKPNQTAILQFDWWANNTVSGSPPNSIPTFLIEGDVGFTRELTAIAHVGVGINGGSGQQIFVKLDSIGGLKFKQTQGGGWTYYRLSLVGWF